MFCPPNTERNRHECQSCFGASTHRPWSTNPAQGAGTETLPIKDSSGSEGDSQEKKELWKGSQCYLTQLRQGWLSLLAAEFTLPGRGTTTCESCSKAAALRYQIHCFATPSTLWAAQRYLIFFISLSLLLFVPVSLVLQSSFLSAAMLYIFKIF